MSPMSAVPRVVTVVRSVGHRTYDCPQLGRGAERLPATFIYAGIDDPIAHWMRYDGWRLPSRPHTTSPQTRAYGSARPATTRRQSLDRQERGGLWFTLHRHGGNVILHHRHIQPVLIRDWSPKMDGITATIWASRTTLPLGRHDRPSMAGP